MVSRRWVLAGLSAVSLTDEVYAASKGLRETVNSVVEDASGEVASPHSTTNQIGGIKHLKKRRVKNNNIIKRHV